MKLAIMTCACFPTLEEAQAKMWIFLRSCEVKGILPILYGLGTPQFPGYKTMMLDMQLSALCRIDKSATHVLFTDGWDAFFTAEKDEIIGKYQEMGSPDFLASAYIGLGNESDMSKYEGCFDTTIAYRYPNRGGYIARLDAAIDAFTNMVAMPHQTGDDCFNWYEGWREGWFRPTLDSGCRIFQVSDVNLVAGAPGSRLFNKETGSFPCVIHLSGGYTDPVHGKDEAMKPWARAAGILE